MYRVKPDNQIRPVVPDNSQRPGQRTRLAAAIARILGATRASKSDPTTKPAPSRPNKDDVEWMLRVMD